MSASHPAAPRAAGAEGDRAENARAENAREENARAENAHEENACAEDERPERDRQMDDPAPNGRDAAEPDPIDDDALAAAYHDGLAREKAGDRPGAIEAFRRALAIDPYDRGGVSVRLAALGGAETPERAPPSYVATLFDQHADVFDHMLVEELGYDAPMQLRDALLGCAADDAKAGARPHFARLLDLGCGTGLCAEALADHVGAADGVDLSEEMVAIAHEKDVYDALYVGDALTFLRTAPAEARWDLITATDVLPYLGDLAPLLDAAAARLAPGGWFAASTETLDDAAFKGAPYRVGPRHRFAHQETYLRARLAAAGLTLARIERIVVRYDEGAPTPGHLAIARAPG